MTTHTHTDKEILDEQLDFIRRRLTNRNVSRAFLHDFNTWLGADPVTIQRYNALTNGKTDAASGTNVVSIADYRLTRNEK